MKHLTKKELKEMMLSAWRKIEDEKEEINKINVFPVPDQDTGSNLAKTLFGIKEAIENQDFQSLTELSDAILEGALSSAQGNAGVIYTGFLAGFLQEITNDETPENITAVDLARGLGKGAERAKDSIQHPKEGTILDVINATAAAFKEQSEKDQDLIQVFKKAHEEASQALLETREKMEIFKKANVVDAGGLGFLIILESYLESLEGGQKEQSKKQQQPSSDKIKRFIQVLANRYEIVSLIRNPNFSQKEIVDKLKKLGNCLDIVRVKDKIKIHIHTDYPDEVKEVMRGLGQIKDLRMEDMSNEVVGEESIRTTSIGLVADGLALILPKIKERYAIGSAKFMPSRPITDLDFYKTLGGGSKSLPTFAAPQPEEYLLLFKERLKDFKKILCITSSAKLSESFENAMKAKKGLANPKKVFVLDSQNITTGQSLVLLQAIDLVQEQWDLEEIVKKIRLGFSSLRSYIVCQDPRWLDLVAGLKPEYARWAQNIDKIVKLNPVFTVQKGTYRKAGVVFAQSPTQAIIKKVLSDTKKSIKRKQTVRVIIGHGQNQDEAQKIRKELKKRMKVEISFISSNPAALVGGFGPGSLMISWTKMI